GLQQEVQLTGAVPLDELRKLYAACDIFVLPSLTEAAPQAPVEAMASGKPVVAFDIKSSAEIIDHGKTGYITDRNNAGEMAQRVVELAENKGLREKMGTSGRKRVEEMFSFEKTQEEIKDLITRSNGI
ncbi:MAG: glycosyltransferase family 4 protein, partial [Bacteroidales bacterium]|nr:glycosyltransferase family 4 protein [Bacteroidales bacterium]